MTTNCLPAPMLSTPADANDSASADVRAKTKAQAASDEDKILVKRAQEGDTGAFDELVMRHSQRLYGLVYHMTSNREDTHDLLQDIFAKAFRSLKRFRGKSSFYTWIYAISVNMTLNFLKKRKRRMSVSLDDVDLAIERDKDFIEITSSRSPASETNIRELQERLNMAMQQLSEDHRAVVTMFDIQGMRHSEISEILGVSAGTIRSRLFYAHRQLQNYLEEFRC